MGKGDLGAFGKIVGKVVALEFKEEATQNLRELLGAGHKRMSLSMRSDASPPGQPRSDT